VGKKASWNGKKRYLFLAALEVEAYPTEGPRTKRKDVEGDADEKRRREKVEVTSGLGGGKGVFRLPPFPDRSAGKDLHWRMCRRVRHRDLAETLEEDQGGPRTSYGAHCLDVASCLSSTKNATCGKGWVQGPAGTIALEVGGVAID